MESRRRSGSGGGLATGAWAPRPKSSDVYNRRRLVAIAVVVVLIAVPLFLITRSTGSGDGEAALVAPEDTSAEPETCRQAVDLLSLRSRLALLLMVGLDGDNLLLAEALLSGADRPGGIFVQSGTAVWDEGILEEQREDLLPQIVAVDDEGGRVQPLAGVLDEIPAAATLTDRSEADVEAAAAERGEMLRDLGIDVAFAAGRRRRGRGGNRRPLLQRRSRRRGGVCRGLCPRTA